jgi:hypothetical protein
MWNERYLHMLQFAIVLIKRNFSITPFDLFRPINFANFLKLLYSLIFFHFGFHLIFTLNFLVRLRKECKSMMIYRHAIHILTRKHTQFNSFAIHTTTTNAMSGKFYIIILFLKNKFLLLLCRIYFVTEKIHKNSTKLFLLLCWKVLHMKIFIVIPLHMHFYSHKHF